nr:hypothetical protein [Tanacetum cinerariifolium]
MSKQCTKPKRKRDSEWFKDKVLLVQAQANGQVPPQTEACHQSVSHPTERLKVDVTPLVPKLRKNRTAHIDYIRHTLGEAATLKEIVESERLLSPLNTSLDYALKRNVWKPTGNMFKTVGHIWKPTGRTFKLVGNVCSLTRIATPTIVPPREPIPIVNNMDKPVVTLVYTRKPKAANIKFLTNWNPTTLGDPQVLMFLLHFLPAGYPNRPL